MITATKSGTERTPRCSRATGPRPCATPAADTDKNGAVSALEAFRYAAAKTSKFYETQKRLATEHSVLEDHRQGRGRAHPVDRTTARACWRRAFTVVRLGANAAGLAGPGQAGLLARKEQLEQAIDRLKYEKAAMPSGASTEAARRAPARTRQNPGGARTSEGHSSWRLVFRCRWHSRQPRQPRSKRRPVEGAGATRRPMTSFRDLVAQSSRRTPITACAGGVCISITVSGHADARAVRRGAGDSRRTMPGALPRAGAGGRGRLRCQGRRRWPKRR